MVSITWDVTFTLKGLHKNLEKAWRKVTARTMKGVIKKVTYWQNYHFEQDSLLDAVDDGEVGESNKKVSI